MSGIATAVIGGTLISGYAQKKAAEEAAGAQAGASEAGIEEQRRQFDAVQELLRPYVEAGVQGMTGQEALLGLRGEEQQRSAIQLLEESPQFQTLVQQGENALLQNASATGGLRGGNLQAALAQYRPQVLAQLIESQYNRLGQISGLGQASATGQAAAGQQTGSLIANLLAQRGQAQAGEALAKGQALGGIGRTLTQFGVLGQLGAF